jgi:septal ring-binding cell division protein DamX
MRIVMILIVLGVIAFLTLKQMGGGSDPAAGSDGEVQPVAVEDASVQLDALGTGSAQSGAGGFTLQVALETNPAAAQRVAASMIQLGETARVVRAVDAEGTPWFLVTVGQYDRLDQAQVAQAALMGKVGMQRSVTVVRQP